MQTFSKAVKQVGLNTVAVYLAVQASSVFVFIVLLFALLPVLVNSYAGYM